MPPLISEELCNGCNRCVELCPEDVLESSTELGGTVIVRYPDECWHCGVCQVECTQKAVTFIIPEPMKISITRG